MRRVLTQNIKHVLPAHLFVTSTLRGVSLKTLFVLTRRRAIRPSRSAASRLTVLPTSSMFPQWLHRCVLQQLASHRMWAAASGNHSIAPHCERRIDDRAKCFRLQPFQCILHDVLHLTVMIEPGAHSGGAVRHRTQKAFSVFCKWKPLLCNPNLSLKEKAKAFGASTLSSATWLSGCWTLSKQQEQASVRVS